MLEDTLGQLRTPPKTEKVVKALSKVKDLKQALEIMVDLQKNYVMLEKRVVTEFSKTTGEPVKYGWKKQEKFGTDFVYGGESYGGHINVQLAPEVIEQIKKGPVQFQVGKSKYIAKFEARDHSGTDRGSYVHCVAHCVYIEQIRKV